MNSSRVLFVTVTLLVSACSDGGPRRNMASKPFSDFDTLTIEQSACLFDCPAFKVSIRSDGLIRHSGPTFDYTGGPTESRADQNGLAQLAKALRVARIDEMRDSYQEDTDGCSSSISDMSTLKLTVSRGRGYPNKSVELYTGCMDPTVPTERINELIKSIDLVTGTGALLEQRKRKRPLDGMAP